MRVLLSIYLTFLVVFLAFLLPFYWLAQKVIKVGDGVDARLKKLDEESEERE